MVQERPVWSNLNRLIIVTGALIVLKLFAYFFTDFLPVFGEVLQKLFTAFLPFILALIVAFLLEPAVLSLMRTLRIRRTYAVILTLITALGILGLFVFLLVARLYTELSELAVSLPDYSYFINFITRQIYSIEKFMTVNPQVQNTLFSATESLLKSLQDWAKSGSLLLLSFLAALPGVFIVLIVSIVATMLVSSSFPSVKRFMEGLFPKKWHLSAQLVGQDLSTALVGFLRAEVTLITVTAFTTIVGLLLIGNRYAVTIGVLAGLLDLVPVVGTGLLFVPWIIGLLVLGSFGEGLKLLVMWLITVILRQFLEPRILSKNIGLEPLPTLVSMYVGLKLFGGAGLILGPTVIIVYGAIRKAGIGK